MVGGLLSVNVGHANFTILEVEFFDTISDGLKIRISICNV